MDSQVQSQFNTGSRTVSYTREAVRKDQNDMLAFLAQAEEILCQIHLNPLFTILKDFRLIKRNLCGYQEGFQM
jgi:hypothetical protein